MRRINFAKIEFAHYVYTVNIVRHSMVRGQAGRVVKKPKSYESYPIEIKDGNMIFTAELLNKIYNSNGTARIVHTVTVTPEELQRSYKPRRL